MDKETLAIEVLHMIKMDKRRWFTIAMIELGIILALIVGIVVIVNTPTEEYQYEQTMEDIEESTATQMIGGNYNGENEAESDLQEKR